jgi:uncharacterized damage-inducible protein DinB
MHERFADVSAAFLQSFLDRIDACVGRLSEEQVWWRPNAETNSVGNLLLHLQGNLSQWVLAGLGGSAYVRHRSEEFTADRAAPKAAMIEGLRRVVQDAQAVIRGLAPNALLSPRQIQGYDVDGVYVVLHVVEHMSYHTGQIVHTTKALLGPRAEVDFYPQHEGE